VLTANRVALDFWTSFALNLVVAVPASWLLAWLVFDRIDRHFVRLGSRSLSRRHNSLDWSRV
jgi:peptidoglycan/LPS O-acetylase OafA/YrhL